ncbi:hypothetical protein NQ318_012615 [Aromia moschata]|uniref:Uncharacterized protein n=1 Tax=Aromia moschata TaxID=1265417 RepID=A0AAV8YKF0_9CUCU|nr:hypothetical protein NQ318_012615 [Aromia moschata]
MDPEPNGSPGNNITIPPPPTVVTTTADPKEYYKTYDVMTGVRIAATLGSFFGLMVLLVLYKSKSKTEKAMEDPNFTAAAVAEVEEEERQLQLALEATACQQLNPRRSRRSLDTSSVTPPGWSRHSTRFSSVGGVQQSPGAADEAALPAAMLHRRGLTAGGGGIALRGRLLQQREFESDTNVHGKTTPLHLNVPRRSSNITCSSSGSSYLERRDSAVALGLPALPAHKCKSSRRQSSPLPEIYDFYYPIDIRVTQPTPGGSPCGSDRALYDRVVDPPNLKPKLAPLASISSCNSSLGTDYPDFEAQSFASDSVFRDDAENTDNEVDEFSTDSDVNSDEGACYGGRPRLSVSPDTNTTPTSDKPHCAMPGSSKSSSTLIESQEKELSQLSLIDRVRRLSASSGRLDEKHSWAQETLF